MTNRRTKRALQLAQRRLEGFYQLEAAPDVTGFIRRQAGGLREALLVEQRQEQLEIALLLPAETEYLVEGTWSDLWVQALEGVSHFVYLAERARTELPLTQLELELQAEVDKYLLLALETEGDLATLARLHQTLFERIRFLDPEGTQTGDRYRLANSLASRFIARLLGTGTPRHWQRNLRRFYRAGQTEKIHLAHVSPRDLAA